MGKISRCSFGRCHCGKTVAARTFPRAEGQSEIDGRLTKGRFGVTRGTPVNCGVDVCQCQCQNATSLPSKVRHRSASWRRSSNAAACRQQTRPHLRPHYRALQLAALLKQRLRIAALSRNSSGGVRPVYQPISASTAAANNSPPHLRNTTRPHRRTPPRQAARSAHRATPASYLPPNPSLGISKSRPP